MKLFIKKLSALLLTLVVLQLLLNQLLPPSWGNEVISIKMEQLENIDHPVNTFFIGTSRVHCHISPVQFDQRTNNKTRSWNIGAPGAAGLETIRIINHLISQNSTDQPRTIYAEIPSYHPPPFENEGNVRATYFYYVSEWSKSVRFLFDRNSGFLDTAKDLLRSIKMLTNNLIGLSSIRHQIDYLVLEKIGLKSKSSYKGGNRGLNVINKTTKRTDLVKKRFNQTFKFYNTGVHNENLENSYLTSDLIKTIEYGNERNVNVVFILMPKIPLGKYEDNYHTLMQLPKKNRLNLSNPKAYPAFYNINHSADEAHLNKKGAMIMTTAVAKHHNSYF